ncbi:Gfo/Idh/MocA family protein [Adhaeretor mobilis]|uniref:Inositol 2-dehydrogenase n=1 Tax=Adhaeretor mobilis TaxID=1930276 RepID=A0A517N038_9BACT|nr:Gfo/Idh/MocA family oxidoreductase [Adhaeretor mobilis]QDT00408.1 Inositol 2-dehydrogenase [Adhaeretor mobilis]
MDHNISTSRRQFLAASAFSASVSAFSAESYARILGSNERIGVGFIGAGGMGTNHLNACQDLKATNNLHFHGVADCWRTRAEHGAAIVKTEAIVDYRKLLDKKEIDYVVIATPEHRHAQMVLDTLDAGKASYCEKPLAHTIREGQAIAKKQEETGRALQVGVQSMSDDCYTSAAKAIAEGVIGQVVQAQIEYVRRYDKQGLFRKQDLDHQMPKPEDLDWAAWLGDAPSVPWNPQHYFEWRCYSAYSGSIATDLFIHRISRIIKACNLDFPRRVVGMGGIWQWNDGRDLPDNFEMIAEYPRGMTVYVLGTQSNRVGFDHLIRGYRGTLYFTPDGWIARDKDGKELASDHNPPKEDIHLHHTNLHNHLREGKPLACPVDNGLAAVAAMCMANESWRTSQMMGWDKVNERMAPAHSLDLSHLPIESVDGKTP